MGGGVRRLRRKEGVIAGGQRSRLKSQIFNPPFLSKVWQNIINIINIE